MKKMIRKEFLKANTLALASAFVSMGISNKISIFEISRITIFLAKCAKKFKSQTLESSLRERIAARYWNEDDFVMALRNF